MNKDKIGMWTSFICLLHCLLLPFIVTSLPVLVLVDKPMEIGLIFLALFVGVLSFLDNYLKHKYLTPLILFIIGFLQILIAKYMNIEVVNFSGLATLILAHYLNYQEIKKKDGCHPHGCDHQH